MLNTEEYVLAVERFLQRLWREKGWDYQEACILDDKNSAIMRARFEVIEALRKKGRR